MEKVKAFFNKVLDWIKSHKWQSATIAGALVAAILIAIVVPTSISKKNASTVQTWESKPSGGSGGGGSGGGGNQGGGGGIVVKYTVTVQTNDETKGTVTGGGRYEAGTNVTIVATPKEDNLFEGWFENDVKVSSLSSYTFEMPSNNVTYLAKFKENVPLVTGDLIEYGRYPQSRVTNSDKIAELNSLAGTLPTTGNQQSWEKYSWYADSKIIDVGWYKDIDIDHDGQFDYRGVYFVSYRLVRTNGMSAIYHNQEDNGYVIETTYWFNYDPIEWKVLDNKTHDCMVMSNKILDAEAFCNRFSTEKVDTPLFDVDGGHAEVFANNYQYSNQRKFLNTSFMNLAFNSSELSGVITGTVKNDLSTAEGGTDQDYICEDTTDKVFALSYADVTNVDYGFSRKEDRILKTTDYAKCIGLYDYEGYGHWYTRSPAYSYSNLCLIVDCDGNVVDNAINVCENGVVPAIRLNCVS